MRLKQTSNLLNVMRLLAGLALSLLFTMLPPSLAAANSNHDPQGFLSSLYYLKDGADAVSFEQAQHSSTPWQKADTASFNFGFERKPVWVKFNLPKQAHDEEFLLEISNPKFESVSVWVVTQNQQPSVTQSYVVDGSAPFSSRPYYSRNYIFPIKVTANTDQTLYIRAQTGYQLRLPLFLWTQDQFRQEDTASTLFQGFYFGIVAIMAFYNLCIYFYTRDKSYGTYALFILFLAGFVATERGLAAEYIWPENPSLDFQMVLLFTALGAGISVPFTSYFLSLNTHAPKIARAYRYFFAVWMSIAVTAIFAPTLWLLFLIVLVLLPGGTSLFVVGVLMWRKGVPAAPFFTIAWFTMVAAASFYDAYLMGLFPVTIFAEYSLQVGNIIEVTLLSLGLANRIKTLDREKSAANLLSKAKSDFLATMSHEIRTPMNGILGMAELLNDTPLTHQQKNYLNTILNSGQTLLTVLNDILDYSKIEAGKFELESMSYDIRSSFEEAAAIFAVKAREKGLLYNLYISAQVPATLQGDPVRVKQVLTNLINNAFKFTKEGSIQIRVGRPDDSSILVEVVDSGIGIAADKIGSIFEKFTQADSSTSRQFGGTGLGLSISKRFIQAMGGQIGVKSQPGVGSTFWFSLPTKGAEAYSAGSASAPISNAQSLLLISPDQALRTLLNEYASLWHISLEFSENLQGSISLLNKTTKQFAITLIDQHCSDFKLDHIQQLMQKNSNTQLLFLLETGEPRSELERFTPTPWFEEFPICISQLQHRLMPNQQAPEKSATATTLPDLTGMQVLVVDDNQVNGMVVTGYLKKLQIQATVVDSGQGALDKVFAAEKPYDLILMDCEMPEIDGYVATQRIREWERTEAKPRTPICALSAHAMESYKEKCFSVGMDDFLSKPINFEKLSQTLAQYYPDNRRPKTALASNS